MSLLDARWFIGDGVSVAGYLHSSDGCFLEGRALADFFAELGGEADFAARLKAANGCFACVVEGGRYLFAAVDKIRSIPLFYDRAGMVSDSADALDVLTPQMLEGSDAFSEYLMTGFVSGSDTLNPNVWQIPAGHYLVLDKVSGSLSLHAYYRYLHEKEDGRDSAELIKDMHEMHIGLVERLIISLKGRQAVIPLSGGYDSRLLAYLLRDAGYSNLLAFSYGAKGNPEARISQKVASYLNIPWLFVEYTHQSWYQAYSSEERKAHYRYAFNSVSSPHIQDWQAIKSLKERGLLDEDAVIIPGHSADFLQNGHLPPVYARGGNFSKEELIAQIIAKHYRLWQNADGVEIAGFEKRITKSIAIPDEMSALQSAALFEYFDMQERQAKFIVNSLRVYEDLGYAWRLPFWDDAMLSYWLDIPLQYRVGRRLWESYAREYLPLKIPVFRDYNIPTRAKNKLLRIAFGEIWDVRYGRFAPFESVRQYANQRVESYLRKGLRYPAFVSPSQPLLRSDINALQALRAIYEI